MREVQRAGTVYFLTVKMYPKAKKPPTMTTKKLCSKKLKRFIQLLLIQAGEIQSVLYNIVQPLL